MALFAKYMPDDIQAYASLGDDLNKQKGTVTPETKEGVVSDKLPELTLDMEDADIIKLTSKWEKAWKESPKKADWEKQIEENEQYWRGKQFDKLSADKNRSMVDNLIFESLETFLPQATRRNPEPLVELDSRSKTEQPNPTHDAYITKVKLRLNDLADKNKLRLKLKKAARHWAVFQLGVAKFGWDLDKDMPVVRIIRPKRIILDPDATIDEDGYTGSRIGEHRKIEASKLLAILGESATPDAKKKIDELTKEDKGTEIAFIEWWTREYLCWTLDKTVLLKRKNPHWNYEQIKVTTSVDTYGNEMPSEEKVTPINHFPVPEMPYRFLSVFNLGDQPMDETSLISQNLSNQDKINKRDRQIDKNADRMNGGLVVSLARSGLTQTQAKGVSEALRKGGVVVIPDGAPNEAIQQYQPNGLPADIYNDRNDTRTRLRDIFGTTGSTPSGIAKEDTVRGKIITRGLDTDRIGGGVTEYLEQFADDIYNWFVQLLYVYDTGFQFVEGAEPPKIKVSVKEGSLLPKDSISIANQALELASMSRISNVDLYKRLEYPNPEELAVNVWLETNAPEVLYKDNPLVQQVVQMKQAAAQAAAQADLENKQFEMRAKHENEMEKEMVKQKGKGSNPSEVPVEGQ